MKIHIGITEPFFVLPMIAWYQKSLCLAWLFFELDIKLWEEKK